MENIKKYDPTSDIVIGACFAILVVGSVITLQVKTKPMGAGS